MFPKMKKINIYVQADHKVLRHYFNYPGTYTGKSTHSQAQIGLNMQYIIIIH